MRSLGLITLLSLFAPTPAHAGLDGLVTWCRYQGPGVAQVGVCSDPSGCSIDVFAQSQSEGWARARCASTTPCSGATGCSTVVAGLRTVAFVTLEAGGFARWNDASTYSAVLLVHGGGAGSAFEDTPRDVPGSNADYQALQDTDGVRVVGVMWASTGIRYGGLGGGWFTRPTVAGWTLKAASKRAASLIDALYVALNPECRPFGIAGSSNGAQFAVSTIAAWPDDALTVDKIDYLGLVSGSPHWNVTDQCNQTSPSGTLVDEATGALGNTGAGAAFSVAGIPWIDGVHQTGTACRDRTMGPTPASSLAAYVPPLARYHGTLQSVVCTGATGLYNDSQYGVTWASGNLYQSPLFSTATRRWFNCSTGGHGQALSDRTHPCFATVLSEVRSAFARAQRNGCGVDGGTTPVDAGSVFDARVDGGAGDAGEAPRPDAGQPPVFVDAGTEPTPTPTVGGCGCGSTSAAWAALAALLLLRRARHAVLLVTVVAGAARAQTRVYSAGLVETEGPQSRHISAQLGQPGSATLVWVSGLVSIDADNEPRGELRLQVDGETLDLVNPAHAPTRGGLAWTTFALLGAGPPREVKLSLTAPSGARMSVAQLEVIAMPLLRAPLVAEKIVKVVDDTGYVEAVRLTLPPGRSMLVLAAAVVQGDEGTFGPGVRLALPAGSYYPPATTAGAQRAWWATLRGAPFSFFSAQQMVGGGEVVLEAQANVGPGGPRSSGARATLQHPRLVALDLADLSPAFAFNGLATETSTVSPTPVIAAGQTLAVAGPVFLLRSVFVRSAGLAACVGFQAGASVQRSCHGVGGDRLLFSYSRADVVELDGGPSLIANLYYSSDGGEPSYARGSFIAAIPLREPVVRVDAGIIAPPDAGAAQADAGARPDAGFPEDDAGVVIADEAGGAELDAPAPARPRVYQVGCSSTLAPCCAALLLALLRRRKVRT